MRSGDEEKEGGVPVDASRRPVQDDYPTSSRQRRHVNPTEAALRARLYRGGAAKGSGASVAESASTPSLRGTQAGGRHNARSTLTGGAMRARQGGSGTLKPRAKGKQGLKASDSATSLASTGQGSPAQSALLQVR